MSSSNKILISLLGLILGVFSLLFPVYPNLAKGNRANQGYVPPNKDKKQQNAVNSGSRGCPSQPADITPLIPKDHIPTTVSTRPSFLFLVKSKPERTVRFSLVEPGISQPLWEQELTVEKPGVLSVSTPAHVSLKINTKYVWNLVVVCNPTRPSENWYIRAIVKRISLSQQLAEKLDRANSYYEKASIFALSGIWYDALATSYFAQNESKAISYFQQLLNQINLDLI